MRLTNGILAVALALGAMTLPALAGVKAPTGEKTGSVVDKKPVVASKGKNLKAAPVETESLSLTTRASHPRR